MERFTSMQMTLRLQPPSQHGAKNKSKPDGCCAGEDKTAAFPYVRAAAVTAPYSQVLLTQRCKAAAHICNRATQFPSETAINPLILRCQMIPTIGSYTQHRKLITNGLLRASLHNSLHLLLPPYHETLYDSNSRDYA